MSRYVMFYSDPTLIKSSGDNTGFIFDAALVFHVGETFELNPREELLIIPCMPNDEGAWKQYRTIATEGRGILGKEETVLAVVVRNKWPRKCVTVNKGVSLAALMRAYGVGHDMSFTSESHLELMQEFLCKDC